MTREIKFRAWSPNRNDFVMGCYPIGFTTPEGFRLCGVGEGDDCQDTEDDGLILEQFTGLIDKNGKEIYEGDVVKWQHGDGTGIGNCGIGISEVNYEEESAKFGLFDKGHSQYMGLDIFRWNPDSLEIIGNIHQKHELI